MRPPSKKLMRIDLIIQMILILPMLHSFIFGRGQKDAALVFISTLMILTFWQIGSSLYTNIVLRMKNRRIHLFLIFAFIVIVSLATFTKIQLNNTSNNPFQSFFFNLVQVLISLYYARVTYLDYKQLEDGESTFENVLDENILDAGMMTEEE